MRQDNDRFLWFKSLSVAERASLKQAAGSLWEAPAGSVIRLPDQQSSECQLLISGLAVRYKEIELRPRQITSFNVPGDFCDLHGIFFQTTNYFVRALTHCTLQRFTNASLTAVINDHPGLAGYFWELSLVDAAIEREWLLNVGRRSPLERVAHLLCELLARLEAYRSSDADQNKLPIPPRELETAQNLSSAEISTVLGILQERGLVKICGDEIDVINAPELRKLGLFDPLYLQLEARHKLLPCPV